MEKFEFDLKRLVLPTILWSLVAEAVYYGLYPVLRLLAGALGWWRLVVFSYLPAVAVLICRPDVSAPQDFGYATTWLIFLPCWVLGCLLAEQRPLPVVARRARIWAWRLGMLALAMISLTLIYHVPHGLSFKPCSWILLLYAVLTYFWLQYEMAWAVASPPLGLLEWGGAWSYSIYLLHEPAAEFWRWLVSHAGWLAGAVVRFLLEPTLILMLCYLFYLLVEKPAQRMARQLGSRMRLALAPPQSVHPANS